MAGSWKGLRMRHIYAGENRQKCENADDRGIKGYRRTVHNCWMESVTEMAVGLIAATYSDFAEGKLSIDVAMDMLDMMIREEFELAKKNECAEMISMNKAFEDISLNMVQKKETEIIITGYVKAIRANKMTASASAELTDMTESDFRAACKELDEDL